MGVGADRDALRRRRGRAPARRRAGRCADRACALRSLRARPELRPRGDDDPAPLGQSQLLRRRQRRRALSGAESRPQVRQPGILRRRGKGLLRRQGGLHGATPDAQVGFPHLLPARGAHPRHLERRRHAAERIQPQGSVAGVLAPDRRRSAAARGRRRTADHLDRGAGFRGTPAAADHRHGQHRLAHRRQRRRLVGAGGRRPARAQCDRRFALPGRQHRAAPADAQPARRRPPGPSLHARRRDDRRADEAAQARPRPGEVEGRGDEPGPQPQVRHDRPAHRERFAPSRDRVGHVARTRGLRHPGDRRRFDRRPDARPAAAGDARRGWRGGRRGPRHHQVPHHGARPSDR